MLEFILKGGKTMIPLFMCSCLALTIIIERFIALQRQKILPTTLCKAISQSTVVAEIYTLSSNFSSALTRIIQGLYDARERSLEAREQVYKTLYKKEVVTLERGLTALEVIASITPLLGLLGTVLGMVDVFNVVAEIGVGQASALSSGIAKALSTTIAGLTIAIPTLVFHSYFLKCSERLALALEEYSQIFFNHL